MSKGVKEVLDDRQSEYGSARKNFTAIGRMWGALLDIEDIDPAIVALMFDAAKSVRITANLEHEDSWIDKEGYTHHGKMIGCAQAIRDANLDDDYVRIAIKYLLEALKEHDDIMRRFK